MGRSLGYWRVAAALAGALVCASLFALVPGSVTTLGASGDLQRAPLPRWATPCVMRSPVMAKDELTFCARVDGRVIGWRHGARGPETHVLLAGGLHLTLVELSRRAHTPAWGSRITVVGPMFKGELGLREMTALSLTGS